MTIATGDEALAADVAAVQAKAASALTAAGAALANSTTALSNSVAAQATAASAAAAAAVALSVPALALVTSMNPSDLVPIAQSGSTVAVTVTTFQGAVNASIAGVLTLATSASTAATAAGTTAASALTTANAALSAAGAATTLAENAFNVAGLTVVGSVGSTDTVPIEQAGSTVAVTVDTLLAAETIDVLSASGAASDTDTILTGQGTNVLTRQTLAALWTWIAGHLPGFKKPVLEVTANLTVDATYCGKILVVTSAGVTISPNYALMGAGFECEIVTSGSGTVTWGAGVTATNGGTGLGVGAYAKFMTFTSSAGNIVLASVGTASGGGVSLPGTISGLTPGAVTSTTLAFTWTAPSSGGAVSYYQVQYRVTGAGSWTQAPGTSVASVTLSGLASSTQYDVQVAAGNAAGLSAYSATVNAITAAPSIAAPGAPTALAVGSTTTTTATLTWTAPGSGGAVASYTVQYRVTSLGGGWTQVPSISGTGATITGLTASTQYDFQVAAVNAGGTSAFTATVHGTTATAPSTTAVWGTYGTTIAHGSGGNIYNLNITGGTTPTSVAIGFSTSQTVAPSPMPAPADGWAGNFNGTWWGTYMNAPSTPGTYYGWAMGYAAGNTLFTIVGPPITVS